MYCDIQVFISCHQLIFNFIAILMGVTDSFIFRDFHVDINKPIVTGNASPKGMIIYLKLVQLPFPVFNLIFIPGFAIPASLVLTRAAAPATP